MKTISGGVVAIGYILCFAAGIGGLFVCLAIIVKAAGFWGLVAAFILGPVTLTVAPWYAGFVWHNWTPLIIVYGGILPVASMIGIGNWLGSRNTVSAIETPETMSAAEELRSIRPIKQESIELSAASSNTLTLEQQLSAINKRKMS